MQNSISFDKAELYTIVAAVTLAPTEDVETWLRARGIYLRQSEIDAIRTRLITNLI